MEYTYSLPLWLSEGGRPSQDPSQSFASLLRTGLVAWHLGGSPGAPDWPAGPPPGPWEVRHVAGICGHSSGMRGTGAAHSVKHFLGCVSSSPHQSWESIWCTEQGRNSWSGRRLCSDGLCAAPDAGRPFAGWCPLCIWLIPYGSLGGS